MVPGGEFRTCSFAVLGLRNRATAIEHDMKEVDHGYYAVVLLPFVTAAIRGHDKGQSACALIAPDVAEWVGSAPQWISDPLSFYQPSARYGNPQRSTLRVIQRS